MATSLSNFVDNLSEISNKKCRDKSCKSKCDFIGIENNKLHYKYNKCETRRLKPINGLIKKLSNTYQFYNWEFFYEEKVFILMNT